MSDARERAEKAYPYEGWEDSRGGYERGWNECLQEPRAVSESAVEAACAGAYSSWTDMLADHDVSKTEVPEIRWMMRAALEAAEKARLSTEGGTE